MWAKQKAFTIVELLIVIVVIAILAAISIVAYNGIQNRANDSTVMSDLKNLKNKIELFKVDNDNLYPSGATSPSQLGSLGFKATQGAYATSPTTDNNIWYCRNSTQERFSVVALSKSGAIFYITHASGPTRYTGATAWSPTSHNCNTIISSDQGWQYAGYASADTTGGPWRSWTR